jgi:hypothetical protein
MAQEPEMIRINVADVPLSEVLIGLTETHGVQFAFDRDLVSRFPVSLNKSFRTVADALIWLVEDLPLRVEQSGNVFLIIPESRPVTEKPLKEHVRISGKVVERNSLEPLPFSNILVNNTRILSDPLGNFTFLASADTTNELKISHLGYYIIDTLITGNFFKTWELSPRVEQIGEVVVEGNPLERSTITGETPGKIKLNHRIAPVLPGFGDNSVFQLLRLMPGILAAGEQSGDLLIWGSYDGHSKTVFDGITLFGLKNFHDDIGVVNPLVIKDMEVLKGGFDVRYGDRVGGIVGITGKNGNLQKPSFTFNINNTTGNALAEIPISSKSSLLAAYRQTYHELFDPSEIKVLNRRANQSSFMDVTYQPDYTFRDANLKYSYNDSHHQAGISVYRGGDNYACQLESDVLNTGMRMKPTGTGEDHSFYRNPGKREILQN